jgi:hypothetical protein
VPEDKVIIKDALTSICTGTGTVQQSPVRFWMQDNLAVSLDGRESLKFGEAVRETLKNSLVLENLSISEIEQAMQAIISNALKLPTQRRRAQVESEVDGFFASVRRRIEEFEVVVPIYNLRLSNTLKLGDVRFETFSEYQAKKWIKAFKDLLRNNPHYDEAAKKEMVASNTKRFIESLKNGVCAKTKVCASERRANEVAFRKINEALDIIKLYCLTREGPRGSNAGLKGEVLERTIRSVLMRPTSRKALYPSLEKMGPLYELEIDATLLKMMRKYGLRKLDCTLIKKNRSWVERKILRAIYWFSRIFDTPLQKIDDEKILAIRGSHPDITEEIFEYGRINDRLVKAVVALESLLVLEKREAVQNNIAERAAYVLGKDFETRKNIKRFIKKVYEYRSETVHNGFTYVSWGELNQLTQLVRGAIITMILRKDRLKLESKDDFYEYFEKMKLS